MNADTVGMVVWQAACKFTYHWKDENIHVMRVVKPTMSCWKAGNAREHSSTDVGLKLPTHSCIGAKRRFARLATWAASARAPILLREWTCAQVAYLVDGRLRIAFGVRMKWRAQHRFCNLLYRR
jgi:hypothetical protein